MSRSTSEASSVGVFGQGAGLLARVVQLLVSIAAVVYLFVGVVIERLLGGSYRYKPRRSSIRSREVL
jgi:hypothetical protein